MSGGLPLQLMMSSDAKTEVFRIKKCRSASFCELCAWGVWGNQLHLKRLSNMIHTVLPGLQPPPQKPLSPSVSIISIFVHYKFELFQHLQPHLCSLSLFKLVQSRSCVAVFHWLGLFHINNWQRHLSRLFVISHKNARGQRFIGQNIINLQLSKIMDFSKG